jgi:hypothetical protein
MLCLQEKNPSLAQNPERFGVFDYIHFMRQNPPPNKNFRAGLRRAVARFRNSAAGYGPAKAEIFSFCAAICLLWMSVTPVTAAQMEDGQEYAAATSTPVTGRNPWLIASSGGAAAASTSFIGIYANNLTGTTTPPLGGLTNTSNPEAHLQIAKAATSSRTYYRSIGTSLTNGPVYFSFLVNVSTNPTTSDEVMCELIPSVAGGSYPANPSASDPLTLHARQETNHFNLGIQSLGGAVSWASNSLADNTDYLVVLEYAFGAGQPCQLFINPVPGAAQPAAGATVTKGATPEPANLGTILFWESSTNTTGTYNYDVMRVDASWANVTPVAGPTITPMRLLFLGNSLLGISSSYSNDIPAILSTLATNLGDSFSYTRIANSGWLLADHATNVASTNLINSGSFDLVVLQEKSETPSLPTDRNTIMFPACRTLNGMITNHAERTMFYETWGQINGDPNSTCNSYDIPAQFKTCNYPSFDSFLSMNIAIRKAYAMIGTELNAAISPAGLAWARVRTERTNLNLYILDDGFGDRHPNSYGAYLTACVFYSAIFGRSPEGSTYYSTNNISDAIYLQRIAAETVVTDPFATDAYGFGPNHYYWAYNWQNYTNPPGSPANTIVISGASATPSPSVKVDTNIGVVTNLWLGTLDVNFNKAGQGRLYFFTNGSLAVTGAMVIGKEGKGFVQHNGGALTVNGALTLGEQTNGTGQYTLLNGALYANQILRGAGNGSFNFQSGQLGFAQFGSGARPLDLSVTAGTLTLTNTAGTSAIFGNYTNGGAATLSIQLSNTSNALSVSGAASLAGTLRLRYAAGFQPALGQQFTLLTAPAISGIFTNILLPSVGSNGLGLAVSISTTSIVATAVNFAPSLSSPTLTTNGGFQFSLTGVAGSKYVFQACTNLTAANWISLQTNSSPFTFQETRITPQRFYRAIYLP